MAHWQNVALGRMGHQVPGSAKNLAKVCVRATITYMQQQWTRALLSLRLRVALAIAATLGVVSLNVLLSQL